MRATASVRSAAAATGLKLEERREGSPPELAADHPLVLLATELTGNAARTVPFGTDASQLQSLAPCIILGPGDITVAHTPRECVNLSELSAAVPVFQEMARRAAKQ